MSEGVELIAAERTRQIEEEGWTAEHDAGHTDRAIVMAAVTYAAAPIRLYRKHTYEGDIQFNDVFPKQWKDKSKELTDTVREPGRAPYKRVWDRITLLAMAGALIAAEIDRLSQPEEKPE